MDIRTDGTVGDLLKDAADFIETRPFGEFEMEGILHMAGYHYRDVSQLFQEFVKTLFENTAVIHNTEHSHECSDPECIIHQYRAIVAELNERGGFASITVRRAFWGYVLTLGAMRTMAPIVQVNAEMERVMSERAFERNLQKSLGMVGIDVLKFEL